MIDSFLIKKITLFEKTSSLGNFFYFAGKSDIIIIITNSPQAAGIDPIQNFLTQTKLHFAYTSKNMTDNATGKN